MLLCFLAIIPAAILMAYIYKKDRMEKEPARLLVKCFWIGMLSVFPTMLAEITGTSLLGLILPEGTLPYIAVENFIVVALVEEGFKLIALIFVISRSRDFDCMFDGIVYSVFVSLGFATLENILYVTDGGVVTAIRRMFTAVPGHMCFAILMGYFYSMNKLGQYKRNMDNVLKYGFLTLGVPVLMHGFYDAILSVLNGIMFPMMSILTYLLWVGYVLAMFIISFSIVNVASKNDRYISEG